MSTIAQNEEDDETFEKIKRGFRVNHMQMKNGENGEVMWEVKSWDLIYINTLNSLFNKVFYYLIDKYFIYIII